MSRSGRRPGAPDTRGAIIDAARLMFADRGYERTTIRAVAAAAGVDPALVHHYFGTKAGMFAAVGELPADPAELLWGIDRHPETAGFEIARRVLGWYDRNPQARATMIGVMRAAVSQPEATAALRGLFLATVHPVLRSIVDDDTAELRASLIASQIAGLALGRFILALPGVADAAVDDLARAVAPALQHYATQPLD